MIQSTPKSSWANLFWSQNRRPLIITGAIALWFFFGVLWLVLLLAAEYFNPQGGSPGSVRGGIQTVVFENKNRIALCRSPVLLAVFRHALDHDGADDRYPEDSPLMTHNLDITIFFRSGIEFDARGRLGVMANGRLGWYFTEASLNCGYRWYTSVDPVPPVVKSLLKFLREGRSSTGPRVFREF